MNIGKAMQTIREGNGLSRREMASKLGCTPTSLWKIDNGRVQPKESTIERFCFFTKTPRARLYALAFEPHDFAPIPSIQDLVDAMDRACAFTPEEINSIAKRLTKVALDEQ